jgi:hypothetical protein
MFCETLEIMSQPSKTPPFNMRQASVTSQNTFVLAASQGYIPKHVLVIEIIIIIIIFFFFFH